MQIVICSATELEIEATSLFLKKDHTHKADILITGVGMLQTTYYLSRYLHKNKPQLIIQAGIAGSLTEELIPGEVVAIKNEMTGDIGVNENNQFVSVFDMNLIQKNVFPWENARLPNKNTILTETGLKAVNGVTINEITTDGNRISLYKNSYKAQIETMEGAALHYVSLMENIPFLQIRAVSNKVGERDKSKWSIKKALTNLNFELQRIIINLKNL